MTVRKHIQRRREPFTISYFSHVAVSCQRMLAFVCSTTGWVRIVSLQAESLQRRADDAEMQQTFSAALFF